MATVTVLNTDAGLSGKTLVNAEDAQTVSGLKTYDRDPNAPFAVSSGSAVVTNLDADKVDGIEGASLLRSDAADTVAGALTFTALPIDLVIGVCEGRLTLTTATAVTTADVTGATTIYFTPYKGNRVALYDGTNWKLYSFTERSLALGTLTADLNYDVFLYDNSGTLTLELTAWTNDTTRATALALQNGVYVKSGTATRRYIGTIRTTSTTATEDSFAKRFVWNYYNRVPRAMRVVEGADTWAYTTATIRQARASAANQLAFVIGVAEVPVRARVFATAENTDAGVAIQVGIGADSTTANATGSLRGRVYSPAANYRFSTVAEHEAYPAVGYHFWAWLEYSVATGATTWVGDGGGSNEQSGIIGEIEG